MGLCDLCGCAKKGWTFKSECPVKHWNLLVHSIGCILFSTISQYVFDTYAAYAISLLAPLLFPINSSFEELLVAQSAQGMWWAMNRISFGKEEARTSAESPKRAECHVFSKDGDKGIPQLMTHFFMGKWGSTIKTITGWWWLEPWNGLWLSIYWQCHRPNWRTPWFFRGVGQPPTRSSG